METRFFRADTLEEALSLLHQYQEGLLIVNGGTDAVLSLTGKKIFPEAILQVSNLPGFHEITAADGRLRIGGGVTYNEMLASPLLSNYHGLQIAISHLASPAIRALGTAAGNICTAAPAADAAAMLCALEAELCLESSGGKRHVALRDFYAPDRSYSTVRRPDELLTAIEIPLLKAGDGLPSLPPQSAGHRQAAGRSLLFLHRRQDIPCLHLSRRGECLSGTCSGSGAHAGWQNR